MLFEKILMENLFGLTKTMHRNLNMILWHMNDMILF